jgi:hypothetical protein
MTGMAMNKFLFNVMSNFHMGESYLLRFAVIVQNEIILAFKDCNLLFRSYRPTKKPKTMPGKNPGPGVRLNPGRGPKGFGREEWR